MTKIIDMQNHNGWGNNISWSSWEKRRIYGHVSWAIKSQIGDEIRCLSESGQTMRFKVKSVETPGDPKDMFFATLEDIGYVEYGE